MDPFERALGHENGTSYRLSRGIADVLEGKTILEGLSESFDLDEYARAGRCEVTPRHGAHIEKDYSWQRSHGLASERVSGLFDVRWEGHHLVVARAVWKEDFRSRTKHWIAGDDRAVTERFAQAVCNYCNLPNESVLVFQGGCWVKDTDLWQSIQSASFDDLVLAGELAREIQDDFTSFLSAKDEYARYGVPWKRGVLFVGPPGNGKTHCLRATMKMLGVPCLYVQSLQSRHDTDDANIESVFARARELTPCCLVFEDLDALITPQNRSAFLNQLDGFASASGMLTLATTNHPDKLDPAIVERPSRFDRKYHLEMPRAAERRRYIGAWRERLDPAMRIRDDEIEALVDDTDGFSFAYLKELFLSAMIRWMRTRAEGAMFGQLRGQLETLRQQMRHAPSSEAAPKEG